MNGRATRGSRPTAIGAPFTSCHVERSETSLISGLRQMSTEEINQRFFASLRMTNGLYASAA